MSKLIFFVILDERVAEGGCRVMSHQLLLYFVLLFLVYLPCEVQTIVYFYKALLLFYLINKRTNERAKCVLFTVELEILFIMRTKT